MAPNTFKFTTGPSIVPDVGKLTYNGCLFSPLFVTEISGLAVKDEANRTVKYMEYNIKVDGYVTLLDGFTNIGPTMTILRKQLSEQGGALEYIGRGFELSLNRGVDLDVAWGPVPEVLDFQPLGAGRSAKIVWQVKVRIVERKGFIAGEQPIGSIVGKQNNGRFAGEMLQFNYDTSISYNEDGFSSITIRGIIEIPLTRTPTQQVRTLQHTVDDLRNEIDKRVMVGIDLRVFRVTNRTFNVSRDKRIMDWEIKVEEIPYMQMPPDCTIARGSYSVRPANTGLGLCNWLCTLRCTYTVRADKPRRIAWLAFLALLKQRMQYAQKPFIFTEGIKPPKRQRTLLDRIIIEQFKAQFNPIYIITGGQNVLEKLIKLMKKKEEEVKKQDDGFTAMLMNFSFDEGLYLDSKTMTFSATWRMTTRMSHILLGSGLWQKIEEVTDDGKPLWAASMSNVMGSESWLPNKVDPKLDVIVDFGD